MGILKFYLGIGSLESSVASLLSFVTGNHDISLFLNLDGKPCLTTCGVKSRGCYGNRKSLLLVRLSFFFIKLVVLSLLIYLFIYYYFLCAVADRPLLEECYQGRIKTALEFALTVDDFNKLVDPRRLYESCLGPEPFAYILKKIAQEEKSWFLILRPFLSYLIDFFPTNLLLAGMATRYSKDKYARVKSLKNEPLSHITLGSKKRKLDKGKDEIPTPLSLFGTPSCPTPSLEMTTFSPPTTHSKGKAKVGKSVWDDLATALGRAHNVITDDELKGFSSIPSHELVSLYILKLVQVFYSMFLHYIIKFLHLLNITNLSFSFQVLGESLQTDYLNSEEKVVVANSKVDSIEAESSKLRKDLIEAMDQSTKAKEKMKELKEALKVDKKFIIQKDEEVQAALLRMDEEHEKVITKFLESDRFSNMQFKQYFNGFELLCRWMMKHHSHVVDFSNLDFEAIDTEILVDKANEKEGETIAEATDAVEGEGAATRKANSKAQTEAGHVEEIVSAP